MINPGTGEKLAAQALADTGDVDRAVMAAQRFHQSGALSDLRTVERGRMVQAMGRHLLDHIDELAQTLSLEGFAAQIIWWDSLCESSVIAGQYERSDTDDI